MRIAVVGGGPAGLFLALLVKRAFPNWTLTVWEQNPPDATFGFGVVLAAGCLTSIGAAAPDVHAALAAKTAFVTHQIIEHRDERIVVDRVRQGGDIGRLDLLQILQEHCRRAGVVLRHGDRVAGLDAFAEYDVIVGADGANSAVRDSRGGEFGTSVGHLRNRFAWYGTTKVFGCSALIFKRHGNGVFIAHYYPYSGSMSTFIVECDAETWDREGFGAMTDTARKAEAERIFARDLDGHGLVENKSVWRQFPVVTNRRWHAGNTVLIGDAARTVHFSIGSGTRVALEDAIALADALRQYPETPLAALDRYEAARRPSAETLTGAAERSYQWYERIRDAMQQLAPLDFVYAFMTRTGRMSDDRLAREHPLFMARYRAARPALARSTP